jgi:hypothetical protein
VSLEDLGASAQSGTHLLLNWSLADNHSGRVLQDEDQKQLSDQCPDPWMPPNPPSFSSGHSVH